MRVGERRLGQKKRVSQNNGRSGKFGGNGCNHSTLHTRVILSKVFFLN